MQEISAKLFELEEEDDTAFEEKILSRLKLAGTRTRRSSAVTLPEVVAGSTPLEEYINARQVLVQDIDIVSLQIFVSPRSRRRALERYLLVCIGWDLLGVRD